MYVKKKCVFLCHLGKLILPRDFKFAEKTFTNHLCMINKASNCGNRLSSIAEKNISVAAQKTPCSFAIETITYFMKGRIVGNKINEPQRG